MTYNFDPDSWYENELAYLEGRHERGEIDADELAVNVQALDHRYEEMVERLDGTYRLPAG